MSQPRRVVSPDATPQDIALDRALRPQRLNEYIGQTEVCEQMRIFIAASLGRGEPLDHTLIFGPPGLGKTTLARIVANEMATEITVTSGPVLEKAGDLAALVTNLRPNSVLFIDEIHRLSPVIEEILYPAMEDFRLDIVIGEGPAARSIRVDLPPFTLIGATTRAGLLTAPLRARFGILQRLEFYEPADMAHIVLQSAHKMKVQVTQDGAWEIGRRSRGTPRLANRLLRRTRDYAEVLGEGVIDQEIADAALRMLKVDVEGFDTMDMRLLHLLIEKFDGGPVGIDNLTVAFGEERDTIIDMIEPYLIQRGMLMRTPRGRVATSLAYTHCNLAPPEPRMQLDLRFAGSENSS